MVRVLVNGARGRMGQEVVKAVTADDRLELVGETDIGDDLARAIAKCSAEVVVDFTTAEAGYRNTSTILEAGARPVIGTSGFTTAQVEELKKLAAAKTLGGVIAPNFAIGAVLMMKFAREAARYLPHMEIVELHHDKKVDSPSGTAIRTAELAAEVRADVGPVPDKPIIAGARDAELHGIPIHSVRLPGLVAQQLVVFGGLGQTLKIEHNSLNRESFMPGVCLACREVMQRRELYYGLEHLL